MRFHWEMFAFESMFARRMEVELFEGIGFTVNHDGLGLALWRSLKGMAVIFYFVVGDVVTVCQLFAFYCFCCGEVHWRLLSACFADSKVFTQIAPVCSIVFTCVRPMCMMGFGGYRCSRDSH